MNIIEESGLDFNYIDYPGGLRGVPGWPQKVINLVGCKDRCKGRMPFKDCYKLHAIIIGNQLVCVTEHNRVWV